MRKEKGITLIALIITIIILIILSAITINSTVGEHGLIDVATEAAVRTRIAEYQENLDQIGIMVIADNIHKNLTGKEYLEEFKKKVEESEVFKDRKSADIIGKEEGEEEDKLRIVTKEGYVFDVTEKETKYVGSLGDKGFEPLPEIKQGSLEIKLEQPEGTETNSWTKGPITVTITAKSDEEQDLSDFIIQYTTDSNATTGWTTYNDSNKPKMTTNGTITARLKNKVGDTSKYTATATVNNIDTVEPDEPQVTTSQTSSSITVTASVKDGEPEESTHPGEKSGIVDIKYEIEEIDNAESKSEEEEKVENSQDETQAEITKSHTFDGLKQDTSYKVTVTAIDKAGNEKSKETNNVKTKKIPGGDPLVGGSGALKFTYSPDTKTGWTNTDVTVTIEAAYEGKEENDNYTIEYTKESSITENTKWSTYDNNEPVTMTTNGTIFARLKDSTGQTGATATATVGNIDKVAPSVPTVITTNVSDVTHSGKKNDLTVSASAHDENPTEGHVNELSGIDGLKFSTDGQKWEDIDANATDASAQTAQNIFKELSDNVYTVQVKAYDHAGNESKIATAKQTNVDTTPPTKPQINTAGKQDSNDDFISDITVTITPGTDTALGTTGVASTTYEVQGKMTTNGTIDNNTVKTLDLKEEGDYTITATSTDGAGNANSNSVHVRRKRSSIEDMVQETNYGEPVNYPVDIDGVTSDNDWKIFYKDNSGNVFIIADDYVQNTKSETARNLAGMNGTYGTYCAYWSSVPNLKERMEYTQRLIYGN